MSVGQHFPLEHRPVGQVEISPNVTPWLVLIGIRVMRIGALDNYGHIDLKKSVDFDFTQDNLCIVNNSITRIKIAVTILNHFT